LWRVVWVALARSQQKAGLVSEHELADLQAHQNDIDIGAALEIEREIHHDLMAEIRIFASQASVGGGKLHLGSTSMDIEDNVEVYRMRRALGLIGESLRELLFAFSKRIHEYADAVCMGFTHLQPAEPTTLGYRLAIYAQDLHIDQENLQFVFENMTAKGMRGAVGTSASYEQLLQDPGASRDQEREVLQTLGLEARDVSTQTYPRKLDYLMISCLAGLGASLSKFAADIRILSSPEFGEVFEPFGKSQVVILYCASASIRLRVCSRRMRMLRGRMQPPTTSSERSTIAPTVARFYPRHCSASTRLSR